MSIFPSASRSRWKNAFQVILVGYGVVVKLWAWLRFKVAMIVSIHLFHHHQRRHPGRVIMDAAILLATVLFLQISKRVLENSVTVVLQVHTVLVVTSHPPLYMFDMFIPTSCRLVISQLPTINPLWRAAWEIVVHLLLL